MNTVRMFSAIAGLHGYLPNAQEFFEDYESAVEFLADIHELGRNRRRALKRDGYIELNLHRDGNEYAEINEVELTSSEMAEWESESW